MNANRLLTWITLGVAATLAAGGACKKQDEAPSGTPAPQPAADAAAASTAADAAPAEAVSADPASGECPYAKAHGGAHEGCPRHQAGGGEPGKCGCGGHGGGEGHRCPHHPADGGPDGEPAGHGCSHNGNPGGCPMAAARAAAGGGCPFAAAHGATPPDPVPTTSMGPLNLPVKTAGELAPERIGQEQTCPVGGNKFTVTAETPAVQHEGQVVLFGCMGCAAAFAQNPDDPAPSPCPHHGG